MPYIVMCLSVSPKMHVTVYKKDDSVFDAGMHHILSCIILDLFFIFIAGMAMPEIIVSWVW